LGSGVGWSPWRSASIPPGSSIKMAFIGFGVSSFY
jgi:hypothetical protein